MEFAPRATALPFGDYMLEGSNISIDTKQDVQEVAGNIGRDHARFVRECDRARAEGYRLVILVEEPPRVQRPLEAMPMEKLRLPQMPQVQPV